jgi:hypothetical protein
MDMKPDFRREHQIAWAQAEAARLRDAFGEAVNVVLHIVENTFTRGDRIITIEDPEGRGISGAICVTDRSEEGSLWRAELLPITGADDDHVPSTRALQHVLLQMRYNRCVHATYDSAIGKASGESGVPDFGDGVARLLNGEIVMHRRLAVGRGDKVLPYARLQSESTVRAVIGASSA